MLSSVYLALGSSVSRDGVTLPNRHSISFHAINRIYVFDIATEDNCSRSRYLCWWRSVFSCPSLVSLQNNLRVQQPLTVVAVNTVAITALGYLLFPALGI